MMKKKRLPHVLAAVALALFVGLGLGSATPTPAGGGGGGAAPSPCPNGRCSLTINASGGGIASVNRCHRSGCSPPNFDMLEQAGREIFWCTQTYCP